MAHITRRRFTLLSAGSVIVHPLSKAFTFAESVGDASTPTGSFFPYSAHIHREPHLPLDQLRHDMPVLKRLGFTMIKIQEVWGYDEPVEGQVNLHDVAQVVADARQNGLRVYFGVTMENPPMWLWRKYPDAVPVLASGQPRFDPTPYVLPSDGKPGPCWHHPGARAAGERFIEQLAKQIGKYDNIEIWNVFQEINFGDAGPSPLGLCYCPHSLAAFRDWLKERYGSLKALNETWQSAYGGWEEVAPPRVSPKVPPFIDWRFFMDDVYLSFSCKWKADVLRRADPLHRPMLAHVGGVTAGSTREWRYAEPLDVLGSSCYPDWGNPGPWNFDHGTPVKPLSAVTQSREQVESILMAFDQLRSAKRDGAIWTAELQGGPITESLVRRAVPGPADIPRWVFACVAAGSRGICFWNHRPEVFWEEGYGFSLLDWGSDTSARAEEAGRIAKALGAEAELFSKGEHPAPAVAIVLNEDSYHWAEGSLHELKQHMQYTITGLWKYLWRNGMTAGFLESAAIPADASHYKALILPFPFALASGETEALSRYVKNGGTLISEACPGRFSNYGMGFPSAMAPGVEELFGAAHKGAFLIREPGNGDKWTNYDFSVNDSVAFRELVGAGEFANSSVFPAYYLQTLSLTTGRPLLLYGDEVAGVVNSLGKGKAYLVGTLLGHAGPAYNDWRNGDFLSSLLQNAGVARDCAGRLMRRRRVLGNKAAWFLFNLTESAIEESIALETYSRARDLFGAELPLASKAVRIRVEPMDIRCLLLES